MTFPSLGPSQVFHVCAWFPLSSKDIYRAYQPFYDYLIVKVVPLNFGLVASLQHLRLAELWVFFYFIFLHSCLLLQTPTVMDFLPSTPNQVSCPWQQRYCRFSGECCPGKTTPTDRGCRGMEEAPASSFRLPLFLSKVPIALHE